MSDNSKVDKSIENALNIKFDESVIDDVEYVEIVKPNPPAPVKKQEEIVIVDQFVIPVSDIEDDYQLARENITNLTSKANDAIDELILLCKDSDDTRAYEVLAKLIDTAKNANLDLLELHTKVKRLQDEKNKKKEDKHVTNNTTFIGSTEDLRKAVENLKLQS